MATIERATVLTALHRGTWAMRNRVAQAQRVGTWTRICLGLYIATEYLAGLRRRYWIAEAVAIARMYGICKDRRSDPVILGLGAAMLHGVAVWRPPLDIEVRIAKRGARESCALPKVSVSVPVHAPTDQDPERERTCVIAVRAGRVIHRRVSVPEHRITRWDDISASDLRETAAWCALTQPAEDAFVVICGILREICGFDRRNPELHRTKAKKVKKELLEIIGSRRGARRARRLVNAADIGAESVAERRLLYLLWRAGFTDILTQMHIATTDGARYADVTLTALGVVVEFEGEAKRGVAGTDTYEQSNVDTEARRTAIEAQGWRVVNVYWADLDKPDVVINRIAQAAQVPAVLQPVDF